MRGRLILDGIEVEGFGSYRQRQTLKLGGQGPVAIVGDNGAGKSTLVSKAVTWCLYGKSAPERMGSGTGTIRGNAFRTIALRGTTRVKLSFVGRRVRHVIQRERKPRGGDILTINGTAAEQGEVDYLIGATYDVFVRTIVRGQGDPWNWAEATDAKKREILDGVSGAFALEPAHEKARAILKQTTAVVTTYETQLIEVEKRKAASDGAGLARKVAEWDAAHQQQILDVTHELHTLTQARDQQIELDKQIEGVRQERLALEAQAPTLDLAMYQRDEAATKAAADHMLSVYAALKARVDLQNGVTVGEPCPVCGVLVDPNVPVLVEASTLQPQLAAAQAEYEKARQDHEQSRKSAGEAQTWLANAQREHQTKLARLMVRDPQAPMAQLAVDQCQARLENLRRTQNPWTQAAVEARAQYDAAERDAVVIGEALKIAQHKQRLARAWLDILNPKGVRAQLAESALVAIESEANKWLNVLSEGTMSIAFPPRKARKGGGSKEEIQTIVTMDGEERDLITFSGGEKRRVNLAVDMGVAAVFATGGALALSLLVLDEEVFSGMDEQGKAAAAQALHAAGVADVVVIDHDPRLSGVLPRTVTVTKGPKGSTIEVTP